jgi:uncharacterized membrane protein (UPF0127 family)
MILGRFLYSTIYKLYRIILNSNHRIRKNQLKENEAMLFVFQQSARHSFWMKDMKFPIDIIWLDSDEKVVYIKENMQYCISTIICILYTPNPDSQYVSETVAGFSQ